MGYRVQVWLRSELFRGTLAESEHQGSERRLADFLKQEDLFLIRKLRRAISPLRSRM
jgi:hypothetical protein